MQGEAALSARELRAKGGRRRPQATTTRIHTIRLSTWGRVVGLKGVALAGEIRGDVCQRVGAPDGPQLAPGEKNPDQGHRGAGFLVSLVVPAASRGIQDVSLMRPVANTKTFS